VSSGGARGTRGGGLKQERKGRMVIRFLQNQKSAANVYPSSQGAEQMNGGLQTQSLEEIREDWDVSKLENKLPDKLGEKIGKSKKNSDFGCRIASRAKSVRHRSALLDCAVCFCSRDLYFMGKPAKVGWGVNEVRTLETICPERGGSYSETNRYTFSVEEEAIGKGLQN